MNHEKSTMSDDSEIKNWPCSIPAVIMNDNCCGHSLASTEMKFTNYDDRTSLPPLIRMKKSDVRKNQMILKRKQQKQVFPISVLPSTSFCCNMHQFDSFSSSNTCIQDKTLSSLVQQNYTSDYHKVDNVRYLYDPTKHLVNSQSFEPNSSPFQYCEGTEQRLHKPCIISQPSRRFDYTPKQPVRRGSITTSESSLLQTFDDKLVDNKTSKAQDLEVSKNLDQLALSSYVEIVSPEFNKISEGRSSLVARGA